MPTSPEADAVQPKLDQTGVAGDLDGRDRHPPVEPKQQVGDRSAEIGRRRLVTRPPADRVAGQVEYPVVAGVGGLQADDAVRPEQFASCRDAAMCAASSPVARARSRSAVPFEVKSRHAVGTSPSQMWNVSNLLTRPSQGEGADPG
jgi:hypothetical protein